MAATQKTGETGMVLEMALVTVNSPVLSAAPKGSRTNLVRIYYHFTSDISAIVDADKVPVIIFKLQNTT